MKRKEEEDEMDEYISLLTTDYHNDKEAKEYEERARERTNRLMVAKRNDRIQKNKKQN